MMDKINKKATIYDYARICKPYDDCKKCPIGSRNNSVGIPCDYLIRTHPDKANEIILKWCEEHPIKTRQDRFLKMFPKARLFDGIIGICPGAVDIDFSNNKLCDNYDDCDKCKKAYWLAEVEE